MCSTSLIITEMQIKTTKRYYLTLIRIASIKETKDNKRWQINIKELPYDPAIFLLIICLRKQKHCQRNT